MMTRHPAWVACMAAGFVACTFTYAACVEPVEDPDDDDGAPTARYSPDQCTVVNPGPGIPDGLVGICHFARDDEADCSDGGDEGGGARVVYAYMRVTPDVCRTRHAQHDFDFRSDDPLCLVLPRSVHLDDVVSDTVLAH